MPMTPSYCARCGSALKMRMIEDRARAVCPACDTVFYENPLPVAASIVLNDLREVLLVKRRRQPHKGQWCLPMGFAEMGETISAAGLRELKEETGIDAIVLRLLDADSVESSYYGDLLIVTFEMQKAGGRERPGDDAEDVRYFPLESPPKLAFSSNRKALVACAAAHRESWAIADSFLSLHSDKEGAMLSDALVNLIEQRADEIAGLWLVEVRTSPTTRSYANVDPDQLMARAAAAISQFGRWLKGDETANEIKAFYRLLARDRKQQGFGVHELVSSITLLKRTLWTFARSQGIWERPIDMYRVLELSRRMAAFYDKAIYHVTLGYETNHTD